LLSNCKSTTCITSYHVQILTGRIHLKALEGELDGFLWCCIAIRAFDRAMRLSRVIYFGLIPRVFKGIKATATYDNAASIIRLDVTSLLSKKDITPGYYYYLYAPGDLQGYQSHPFILCSWRQITKHSLQTPPDTSDDKTCQRTSIATSSNNDIVHSLLTRPYRGFTTCLRNKLTTSSSPVPLTVFLEGPYGHPLDLTPFSDVLIIVGGSGITAAISYTNHLLLTHNTAVHVFWVVQNSALVDNVCAHELKDSLANENFEMVVYETRKPGRDAEEMERKLVNHGRPDVELTIREAREKCKKDLAVVVCGPPRMVDACRVAVVDVLGERGPRVKFYNEALGW
jgi:ferredoxin-NADP reductase